MAATSPTPNLVPIHVRALRKEQVLLSAANTNLDGVTGTYVEAFEAGAAGSRIARIDFKAIETTTDGMIRIFRKSGGTLRLIAEVQVEAVAPSGTVPAWSGEWVPEGIDGEFLAPGQSIHLSTENAEDIVASCTGGDY